MNDEFVQALGFDNADQFSIMVANVDISTPDKLAGFKNWQENDGTKDGIEKLPMLVKER